jgi:hypothetical protein
LQGAGARGDIGGETLDVEALHGFTSEGFWWS